MAIIYLLFCCCNVHLFLVDIVDQHRRKHTYKGVFEKDNKYTMVHKSVGHWVKFLPKIFILKNVPNFMSAAVEAKGVSNDNLLTQRYLRYPATSQPVTYYSGEQALR